MSHQKKYFPANLKILLSGVRQEQDIYVRLIDSVTKQVSL